MPNYYFFILKKRIKLRESKFSSSNLKKQINNNEIQLQEHEKVQKKEKIHTNKELIRSIYTYKFLI